MSFHFVDHISHVTAGGARGTLAVPATLSALPDCLLAEALGQLAGWFVQDRTGFALRPIAARAREVRLLRPAAGGERVTLEVEIRRLGRDAVRYDARAHVEGDTLLEIDGSLGPLIPAGELEEPAAARARYARLRDSGLSSLPDDCRLPVPPAGLGTCRPQPGGTWASELAVPANAPFFCDHFPRRPVYPATLLLDALARVAAAATAARLGTDRPARPVRVRQMKVRAFTSPGERLRITAREAREEAEGIEWTVAATGASGTPEVATASILVGGGAPR